MRNEKIEWTRRAMVVSSCVLALLATSACEGGVASGRRPMVATDGAMPPPPTDAGTPSPFVDPGPRPTRPDPFASIDRTRPASCRGEWVVGVTGRVLRETGRPLLGAYAQACLAVSDSDRRVCLPPGMTDDAGLFAVLVPEEARCVVDVVVRVVVPEQPLATAYCRTRGAVSGAVADVGGDVVLYETRAPIERAPLGAADARHVVRFADGVELDVVPSAIGEENYPVLSARTLSPVEAERVCPGASSDAFDAVLVFAPETSVFREGGASLALPAAGRAGVDLFVLGGLGTVLADGSDVPEAEWVRFGRASGGEMLRAPVPHLGAIGLR